VGFPPAILETVASVTRSNPAGNAYNIPTNLKSTGTMYISTAPKGGFRFDSESVCMQTKPAHIPYNMLRDSLGGPFTTSKVDKRHTPRGLRGPLLHTESAWRPRRGEANQDKSLTKFFLFFSSYRFLSALSLHTFLILTYIHIASKQ